jgi:hypothetical protein
MNSTKTVVVMLTALNILSLFGTNSGRAQIPDSIKIIEKVYLQTDRSTYYPSEDIWFKAYLVDAYDKLLSEHSKNLHIELISNESALIGKDSIKPEKNYSKFIQYAEMKRSTARKYRLSDTIMPGEVTIIAKRVDDPESARARSRRYLMSTPDREIVISETDEKYNNTFQFINFNLLAPIATKMPSGAGHRLVSPIYLIDGVYASEDELRMLPVDWVERIDVATNEASLAPFKLTAIGMSFAPPSKESADDKAKLGFGKNQKSSVIIDGVISIITRNSYKSKAKPVFYSANFQVSGYDEPRLFYSPKHHTSLQSDYKPDLRITLFWKPDIILENNNDLVLNYYNADNPGNIKITVEGITSTGIPVTGTADYKVK